jgi:hypothetical protein
MKLHPALFRSSEHFPGVYVLYQVALYDTCGKTMHARSPGFPAALDEIIADQMMPYGIDVGTIPIRTPDAGAGYPRALCVEDVTVLDYPVMAAPRTD